MSVPNSPSMWADEPRYAGRSRDRMKMVIILFIKVYDMGEIKLISSLFVQGKRSLGNCVKSNESIVYLHVAQLDNVRLLLIRFIDETGGGKIIFYLQSTLF